MKENMDPNYLGEEEEDIYKENILDHFRNPRNFGELVEAEIKHSELNSVCGDFINIFASVDKDNIVQEIKFKGNGCAVSMAATSMLTEKLKGKSLDEIKNITSQDVMDMIGIKLGVVRTKCGLLCLNTVKKGIENMEGRK